MRNGASDDSATDSRQRRRARGLDRGRFSQGQELTIDENPEKHIRRRYSEGLETKRPSISGSPGVGEEASRFPICARTIGHACS